MEEKNTPETVPYFAYEGEISRQERHIKRLWIALIISIILIFMSNGAWLLYESLYDKQNMFCKQVWKQTVSRTDQINKATQKTG